jgi:hypothetical protein
MRVAAPGERHASAAGSGALALLSERVTTKRPSHSLPATEIANVVSRRIEMLSPSSETVKEYRPRSTRGSVDPVAQLVVHVGGPFE